MADSKHTPGPWSTAARKKGGQKTVICADTGGRYMYLVGEVSNETDARLIAAAPDMLEACRRALSYIERDEAAHGREFGEGNIIRAAIAKAEGL